MFDFDTETSVLSRAQGAILLTFQTTALDLFSGTRWLSAAIQLAKSAEADMFGHNMGCGPDTIAKKRLWWCIILRDRIHSLALRRPIQLGPGQGRIPTDYLDEVDMRDEIQNSQVYKEDEKRQLVTIFRHQCHLAVIITELINVAYAPLWSTLPKFGSEEDVFDAQDEIDQMKNALQKWADLAKGTLEGSSNSIGVVMFTKLTYMYYEWVHDKLLFIPRSPH